MGLYSRHVFPRLCDWAMRAPQMSRLRRELLVEAGGDILEIGFGTGLNLEHYPARILGRRPHQIVYPITTGKIPEPEGRVAGRRLFTGEDVKRIARHLGVCPNWDALDPPPGDGDAEPPARLTLRPPFEVTQVGETGHEVRDGDGEVFAWSPDRGKALVLAGLLESAARC